MTDRNELYDIIEKSNISAKEAIKLIKAINSKNTESVSHLSSTTQSDKIGKYVIVRCRDAGVHAGILVSTDGRSCSLKESRRLWYWKPANGSAFLSGIARYGLDKSSRLGEAVHIELTENCEIIVCSEESANSISSFESYTPTK